MALFRSLYLIAIAGLALSAGAMPVKPGKRCVQLDIPVQVVANNSRFHAPSVDSNIDAIDWIWYSDTWSHKNVSTLSTGIILVHDTYAISAQLCVPSPGPEDRHSCKSQLMALHSTRDEPDPGPLPSERAKGVSDLTSST